MFLKICLNFIKVNAPNSRLFAELRKESDSEFVTFLLHSHVRWLSKGKVLKRVFIFSARNESFFARPKTRIAPEIFRLLFLDVFFILGGHFGIY